MFTETRVREITVSKAEAVEVIIRNLHVYADSPFCAGHDYEQAFRDAVRAIEQRDVAALSAAIQADGNAESELFPDGVDLDGVTLDDDWLVENLGSLAFLNSTTSTKDRCRLLEAGIELPCPNPTESQIIEAALDAGIPVAEQSTWTAFDDNHSQRAVLLVHPRTQLSDADLLFEYVRARDQKAADHLLNRDLTPVDHLRANDLDAFKTIRAQFKQTYAFLLEHAGLAYEYVQRDYDEIHADLDDSECPQRPADEIFRNEILRRIQAGSTTPFIPLGTTDQDIAKMIADVGLAKSITSAAIEHGPGQRKRNRGTANSL